ncbi:hypothetical protein [Parafilimonas sp.]|uniref:hypothetical protein n=1 Tax=Parafilimonas sp. TaxID=1969739 RepID=UPI0039E35CD4
MLLDDLEILFDDLGFSGPTAEQLQKMLDCFMNDFVLNPFKIKGANVTVSTKPSWHRDFRGKPETFVHLITRESKYKGEREFDHQRANRIHWVKEVLLNHNSGRIKYYEYADEKGVAKQHYWFEEQNFMVVLKSVLPDLMVITAFCIDDFEKPKHRKRYNAFRNR